MVFRKIKDALSESIAPTLVCCFCGEEIDRKALVEVTLGFGQGENQGLWAHGNCLKERLHNSVPFITPEQLDE